VSREKNLLRLRRTLKCGCKICHTRGIWRGLKAGTNINCLMTTYYPDWIITYWSKSEQDITLKAQIDALDNFPRCP
jgi:hypothetical protein